MSQWHVLAVAFVVSACDPGWDYEYEAAANVEDGMYDVPHKWLGIGVSASAFTSELRTTVTIRNLHEGDTVLAVPQLAVLDKRGVSLKERFQRSDCPRVRNVVEIRPGGSCKVEGGFEITPRVPGMIGTRNNPDLENVTVKVLFEGVARTDPIIIPLVWD